MQLDVLEVPPEPSPRKIDERHRREALAEDVGLPRGRPEPHPVGLEQAVAGRHGSAEEVAAEDAVVATHGQA